MKPWTLLAMALLSVTACSKPAATPIQPAAAPERTDVVYLTPVQQLIRVSMDLRGIRPTIGELEDIQANPGKIGTYIDTYMEDPRFAERVKEIWNENYLTRQDSSFFPPPPSLVDFVSQDEFAKATGNEPLELISHVVTQDRPFTEVVTANYTMANGVLANYFNIVRPADQGSGWVESQYADGRPNSGVLSSTDFFTRWRTTSSNKNRGRANATTRATLCFDFLSRNIIINTALNLADPNVVNTAVRTDPACAGCHQILDPLGSYYYGWYVPDEPPMMGQVFSYPLKTYSPSAEDSWPDQTGRAPGYFGLGAGSRIDDLGKAISVDPRFASCSVQRFEASLTGREPPLLDFNEVNRLENYFVAENFNAKKLIKAILLSPEYNIAAPTAESASGVVGMKLIMPEALDRMLNDLTGFRWQLAFPQGFDLLENDTFGFREMAGGYDSVQTTAPAYTVNATHILTLRMAASDAAGQVVDAEFAQAQSARRLLTKVTVTDTAPAAIEGQYASLALLLYGETLDPTSPEARDANVLWQHAYQRSGSVQYAWKVTLAAMFSDIRIAFY